MATLLLDSLPSLKKVMSATSFINSMDGRRAPSTMVKQLGRQYRVNFHIFQASNWLLDLYGDDLVAFRKHVKKYKQRGLQVTKKRKKEWRGLFARMISRLSCLRYIFLFVQVEYKEW